MPAKSSAKLGEVKRRRGGEHTGEAAKYGASVVHRRLERPATHRAPRTGDGSMLGATRGSTWSDHGVRATSEVANSRESEAALGD